MSVSSLAFISRILRPFPLCCRRHSSATSCPGTESFCLKPQSKSTSAPIGATIDGTRENTTNTTGWRDIKKRERGGEMLKISFQSMQKVRLVRANHNKNLATIFFRSAQNTTHYQHAVNAMRIKLNVQ